MGKIEYLWILQHFLLGPPLESSGYRVVDSKEEVAAASTMGVTRASADWRPAVVASFDEAAYEEVRFWNVGGNMWKQKWKRQQWAH